MDTLGALMLAVDALLGLGMLASTVLMLASANLYRAIILFVLFSLFLGLVWVRLTAPDIALAEVAIGTGLTGALFIAAVARLTALKNNHRQKPPAT